MAVAICQPNFDYSVPTGIQLICAAGGSIRATAFTGNAAEKKMAMAQLADCWRDGRMGVTMNAECRMNEWKGRAGCGPENGKTKSQPAHKTMRHHPASSF
jgi:hypothetical protein